MSSVPSLERGTNDVTISYHPNNQHFTKTPHRRSPQKLILVLSKTTLEEIT